MSNNHSLNRTASTVPDNATFALKARELSRLYGNPSIWKWFYVAVALVALIAVSLAMAQVTGGVIKRIVNNEDVAAFIGALIHLSVGLAAHFWMVGAAQDDPQDKAIGVVFLTFSVGTLAVIAISRAMLMMDEGRSPAFAWSVSSGVLMVEGVVPILLGVVFAKAWLAKNDAADEARFYHQFQRLIERDPQPAERWNDAETRQEAEIAHAGKSLSTATPEKKTALQADIERCTRRWFTLMESNPARAFRRPAAPKVVIELSSDADAARPPSALPAVSYAPSADGTGRDE
jgi:hypothetical protein